MGWIGVDLDGTLAHSNEPCYIDGCIGDPVTPMLAMVKRWLNEGRDVRIFTARAVYPGATALIHRWCLKHGLPALPITNAKDPEMEMLLDDRAVGVERNTGRITGFILP